MIETWKQCYTGFLITKASNEVRYLQLGPLRGEGYIKELRMLISSWRAQNVRYNAVVSGTGRGGREEFEAGSRIIEQSNLDQPGMLRPCETRLGEFLPLTVLIPMWRKVETGSRWVIIAFRPGSYIDVSILATVTVVGLERLGVKV